MIIKMKDKSRLEELSEQERAEIYVAVGALAERFRGMREMLRETNCKIEKFTKHSYLKENSNNEYYRCH